MASCSSWPTSASKAGTALAAALILLAGLVAITAIDLDHQIIPDVLSLPGIALGVLFSLAPGGIGWAPSLLGVLLGGGVFVVIIVASTLVLGQAGMGVGDVKLGAMLGAFLGWKLALLSILLSTLAGRPHRSGPPGHRPEEPEGPHPVRSVPRAGRLHQPLLG